MSLIKVSLIKHTACNSSVKFCSGVPSKNTHNSTTNQEWIIKGRWKIQILIMTLPSECGAVKDGERERAFSSLACLRGETTRGNDAERNKRGMRNDLSSTSSRSPREGRQSMYYPQKMSEEERANIARDCRKVALYHHRHFCRFCGGLAKDHYFPFLIRIIRQSPYS